MWLHLKITALKAHAGMLNVDVKLPLDYFEYIVTSSVK